MASELDLMLLGKTGAGKSRTGNSILGRKAFHSVCTAASVTINSQKEITELEDGRRMRVVDTPGVGDTRMSEQEGKDLFRDAVKDAIVTNPMGYHALLLVIRFGSRFTAEDENTVRYLKEAFGENFIRKFCIIVMTCGDTFKDLQDDGEIDGSFLDWCRQQTGFFQQMFQEVNGRILLFDNRGSKDAQATQRRELVEMVDKLAQGGRRYTDTKFQKAKQEREKLIVQNRMIAITDEVQEEVSLILLEKERIENKTSVGEKLVALENLMGRIKAQLTKIDQEDNGTGVLIGLRGIILEAQTQVDHNLIYQQLNKDLEEKKSAELNETREAIQQLEEQVKKLTLAQGKTREQNEVLTQNFQTIRDENDRQQGQSIWSKIWSWFW